MTPAFLSGAGSFSAGGFIQNLAAGVEGECLLDQMLYIDSKTWLPDDLLVKADKMTMANSLELRVPLLDHKVLEFAASLPAEHKVRGRETKRALKAAFARALPREILTRKKAGFPVPVRRLAAGRAGRRRAEVLLSERCAEPGLLSSRGSDPAAGRATIQRPIREGSFLAAGARIVAPPFCGRGADRMKPGDKPVRVLYSFPLKLGAQRICTTAWQQVMAWLRRAPMSLFFQPP